MAYFGAVSSCTRARARFASRSYSSAILRIVSLAWGSTSCSANRRVSPARKCQCAGLLSRFGIGLVDEIANDKGDGAKEYGENAGGNYESNRNLILAHGDLRPHDQITKSVPNMHKAMVWFHCT